MVHPLCVPTEASERTIVQASLPVDSDYGEICTYPTLYFHRSTNVLSCDSKTL